VGKLQSHLDAWDIEHFTARELVSLHNPNWAGPRHPTPPPDIIENIRPTVRLAEEIRIRWGAPIQVVSGWRPSGYNRLVGGASNSQHKIFKALDIRPKDMREFVRFVGMCCTMAAQWRAAGHSVGIGIYRNFVHLDVGYRSRHWTG
jgi:hypothetical protein